MRDQHYQVRAILESALDLTTNPRFRQLLRCMLARNAAWSGDIDAAQRWLALCNSRPLELYMDSAYRLSLAAIHTAKGDYQQVFELLGAQPRMLPIAASYEDLSDLYRANALEKTGQLEAAVQQIEEAIKGLRKVGKRVYLAGYFSGLIVMFMIHQSMALCTASFPAAYKRMYWSELFEKVTWDRVNGSVSMRTPLGGWFGLKGMILLAVFLVVLSPLFFMLLLGLL